VVWVVGVVGAGRGRSRATFIVCKALFIILRAFLLPASDPELQPRQGLFMIHSVAPFGRGHFVNSNAVARPPDLAQDSPIPSPSSSGGSDFIHSPLFM